MELISPHFRYPHKLPNKITITSISLFICLFIHSPAFATTVLFSDTFESGMGNWSNTNVADNKSWTRNSGGTPSYNTGPSAGASASSYYMYLETSSGSAYYNGDSAILLGPLLSGNDIHLLFDYHMFGNDIGTLSVDVLSAGSWINDVSVISGQQHIANTEAYSSAEVDLSTYSVSQVRFRASAVGGYTGDIAIDNILITSQPSGPMAPQFKTDPIIKPSARQSQFYIDSISTDALDDNGDPLSFRKISGPNWLSVATDGTVSGTPSTADIIGNNSFIVEVSDGDFSNNATLNIFVNDENAPVTLNSEDFETGLGSWHNVTTDDNKDWSRHSGGTTSVNTGPNSGANSSNYYAYLETSSGSAYNAGDTAILEGPQINAANIEFSFDYHLYGLNTGTLYLDVLSEGHWITDVWSLSGQQHNSVSTPYRRATINLSAYQVTKIRFRAIAIGGYQGDIAIDNPLIRSINPATLDSDGDGVIDKLDLCPSTPATEIANSNGCSISQRDTDNDGIIDSIDAFPHDASEWLDSDTDGIGNNADNDDDNDNITDAVDDFPLDSTESVDTDGDLIGNNADLDDDNDGVLDVNDGYPLIHLSGLTDTDNNGIPNDCDAICTSTGMLADLDDDGDGVNDTSDHFPLNPAETLDSDADGVGNNADTDDDNDGIADNNDAFPLIHLNGLLDSDGNGQPNNCEIACLALGMTADPDDDGDGVQDTLDSFPIDANESVDTDMDGIGNNADPDDDNDAMPDAFENQHAGLDSLIDDAQGDLDADGVNNLEEYLSGTNPSGTDLIAYSVNHRGYTYQINLYNGEVKSIGSIGSRDKNKFFTPSGIAISPMGILYVVDSENNNLHSVNLNNGRSQLVAPLSQDVDRVGLSFDSDGTLWLVSGDARLYSVNTSTGFMTLRGQHGIANIDSLAWDGSTLYGIASNSDNQLFKLNRTNGSATVVGNLLNIDITQQSGLTYQANGTLWGIARNGNIFSIDAATGTATLQSTVDASFTAIAVILDSDEDGMPDGWEDFYGLDKFNRLDAMQNNDSDTLSNIDEYFHGSNPQLSDTDADGVIDNADVFPTDSSEWQDSDGDFQGNNVDLNDDNDLFDDIIDPFPLDPSKPQWLKKTLHDITGTQSSSAFSINIDKLGDINGDGADDFIVGRKTDKSAKVYSGADGHVIYDLTGPDYSNFGERVANIGDINGDSVNDFAISAPITKQVFVYSGANGALIYNWAGGASYGSSLSKAGDVNKDGVPDIVIGAPDDDKGGTVSYAGSIEVRSGIDGSILHRINGSNSRGYLGYSVSDIGDVNGDGYDDFVAKTYSSSSSNRVIISVYSGHTKNILKTIDGNYGSSFGNYLENVGDIDKDGVDDLAISYNSGEGRVQIVSMKTKQFIATKYGESYSRAGYTVANAGDFNGDGINDYLMNLDVTANGNQQGRVWLVSGANNSTLFEFLPGKDDNGYGYGLATIGDVNSDGITDFAFGASANGRVEVLTLLLDSDSDGVADSDDAFPLNETLQ